MNTQLRNPGKLAFQARWHEAQGNFALADELQRQLHESGRCKRCGQS